MGPSNDNQYASSDSAPEQPADPLPQEGSLPPNPQPPAAANPEQSAPETPVTAQPVVSGNIQDIVTPSGQPSPEPTFGPVVSAPAAAAGEPKAPKNRKRVWRMAAIVFAAVVVLAGGGAAAFYTVYLPRQPWYMLDTALKNSMSETNLTSNITLNSNSTGSSGIALKANGTVATNLSAKMFDVKINVVVAGTSIPVELRLVDSNLYFEFGDLSSLSSLISLAGSNYASIAGPILSALSNHWFVVDSTLLDESKDLKCLLNSNWTLSSSDSNYLVNSYLKKPFFKVQSASSTTVNGVSSEKLNVSMNNNEAAAYLQGLPNLQFFKSMDQCTGESASGFSTKSLANGKTTPLTIWVDKSTHRIDQVEYVSQGSGSDSGSIIAGLNYSPVNIQAPSGAVPVTQLLSQLEQQLKSNPQLESALGSALLSL